MENIFVENVTLLVVLFSFFYFFTMAALVRFFRQNQNEEKPFAPSAGRAKHADGHLRAA